MITAGQASDAPPCKVLLQGLQPNQVILADKAYDADWIRDMIYDQGAIECIPPKSNRKKRFFGRIKKSFRSIVTRYDKYATNFMAMIKIASVRLWCEFYESTI